MKSKVVDRKTLISFLRENGFTMISCTKHEKWSNGTKMIIVPKNHTKSRECRPMFQRLAKEAMA